MSAVNKFKIGDKAPIDFLLGLLKVSKIYLGGLIVFDRAVVGVLYTLTISPNTKNVGATASSVEFTIESYKETYVDGVPLGDKTPVSYSLKSNLTWAVLSGDNLNINENLTLEGRSAVITVTLEESNKTVTANITLAQGSYTYSEITISNLSCNDIPASGGSINSGTVQYSQTYGWNGRTSGVGTITSGANITWTPVTGVASKGTNLSGRTNTGKDLGVTVKLNGKTATKSVDVYLAANTRTAAYINKQFETTYKDFPASGLNKQPWSGYGNVSKAPTAEWTYTSGSKESIVANSYISWINGTNYVIPSLGTTVKERSRILQTEAPKDQVIYPDDFGLEILSYTPALWQEANNVSYGNITITRADDTIPASGGSVDLSKGLSYTLTATYTSTATKQITSGANVSYALKSAVEGFSIQGSTLTATLTTTDARSCIVVITVSMNGKTATEEVTISQGAGSKTYSEITASLSYNLIPAAGGKVTPKLTYSLTWGWNGSTTGGGTITSGAKLTWSGTGVSTTDGSYTGTSLGTTVKAQTQLTTATVNISLNGKTKSVSSGISQAANNATYSNPVVTMTYSDIPAAGGSVTPNVTFTQQVTYTSGATSQVTSGGSKTFSGTNVNTTTGQVSGSNLGTTEKARTQITTSTVSVVVNGKTGTKATAVYLAANSITYLNPTVTLTYPDISAGGSTVSPNISYTQKATYTSGGSKNITTGGTITYSGTSVNTQNGQVSASGLGTTAKARTKITTATATVTLNGKSGSKSADVYQAANTATYGNVSISGGSVSDIPASGGNMPTSASGITAAQTVTFTSGSTRAGTVNISYTKNPSTAIPSLGTTVKTRTKVGTLTATATGEGSKTATKQFDVYLAANNATYGELTGGSGKAPSDIPAAGGNAKGTTASKPTQTISFTSGSTRQGTVTEGTWSTVSGTNLGTTEKARTKLGTSSCTFTGEGSKTKTLSVDVYQLANTKSDSTSWNAWLVTCSANPTTISAPGGTSTISSSAKRTGTITHTYTSGSKTTNSTSLTGSTKLSISGTGFTLSGNIVTASKNTGGQRTATVTATCVEDNARTDTATVTLASGQVITSYGAITISGGSVSDIPAYGGTVKASGCTASQSVTYSSGNTGTINVSSNITYSSVSADDRGLTVGSREQVGISTATCTANGKTATKNFTVYLEANEVITYGVLFGGSTTGATIPASGGSAQGSLRTKPTLTITYTSGSTRAGSVSVGTFSTVSAQSKGTTVSGVTTVGTSTATATGEGGTTKTLSATISQAANEKSTTYGTTTVDISSSGVGKIPAAGGSRNITVTASRPITYKYTSGATLSGGTENIPLSSISVTSNLSYCTINSGKTSATFTANTGAERTAVITASVNGASDSTTLILEAGSLMIIDLGDTSIYEPGYGMEVGVPIKDAGSLNGSALASVHGQTDGMAIITFNKDITVSDVVSDDSANLNIAKNSNNSIVLTIKASKLSGAKAVSCTISSTNPSESYTFEFSYENDLAKDLEFTSLGNTFFTVYSPDVEVNTPLKDMRLIMGNVDGYKVLGDTESIITFNKDVTLKDITNSDMDFYITLGDSNELILVINGSAMEQDATASCTVVGTNPDEEYTINFNYFHPLIIESVECNTIPGTSLGGTLKSGYVLSGEYLTAEASPRNINSYGAALYIKFNKEVTCLDSQDSGDGVILIINPSQGYNSDTIEVTFEPRYYTGPATAGILITDSNGVSVSINFSYSR